MSYSAINAMFQSQSLRKRIIACAAQEGEPNPEGAVSNNIMWRLVTNSEWVSNWTSAVAGYTEVYNPDTGARPDVITDGHILAAVQAVRTAAGA
jgi:hypothetical protein